MGPEMPCLEVIHLRTGVPFYCDYTTNVKKRQSIRKESLDL